MSIKINEGPLGSTEAGEAAMPELVMLVSVWLRRWRLSFVPHIGLLTRRVLARGRTRTPQLAADAADTSR